MEKEETSQPNIEINLLETDSKNAKILSIKEITSNERITELKQKIEKYNAFREAYVNAKKKFGESEPDEHFEEEWRGKYIELEKEVGMRHGMLDDLLEREINKQAGLDPESLNEIEREYLLFEGYPEEEINTIQTKSYRTFKSMYIPLIALIKRICKENLEGKVIVEIGPGEEGIRILSFISTKGAEVIGVDNGSMHAKNFDEKLQKQVKKINGRWEDLSLLLQEQKADIIYTHHMHPNPHFGGKFEKHFDRKDFYIHVLSQMHNILKPGGVLISHRVDYDSGIPNPNDYGYKYDFADFMSDRKKDVPSIGQISIYQKRD